MALSRKTRWRLFAVYLLLMAIGAFVAIRVEKQIRENRFRKDLENPVEFHKIPIRIINTDPCYDMTTEEVELGRVHVTITRNDSCPPLDDETGEK